MNETAESPKNPWQVSDLLEKTLVQNANRASEKLRALLATKIIIELTETKRRYLIDWTAKEMSVKLITPDITAETQIVMSDRTLGSIGRGELNPQLAFVSGAIYVKGKTEPAMYLFNLLARS